MTRQAVLADYPDLEDADVDAVIAYAARQTDQFATFSEWSGNPDEKTYADL